MLDSILYLITDRHAVENNTMLSRIEQSFKGGLRIVQLRDKDQDTIELIETGLSLRKLCNKYKATFIVNRNIEVYEKCKADGLHLGTDAIPEIKELKAKYPGIIVGTSTHSIKEALQAEKEGADYVTLGPAYETPSKKGMGEPLGPEKVGKGANILKIPVFALGGIEPKNVEELKKFGIKHLAMIRSVLAAENPQQTVEDLLKLME